MGVAFELDMEPIPCPRPKVSRSGRVFYPGRYSNWKSRANMMLGPVLASAGILRPWRGPLMLSVDFYVARPKTTQLDYPHPDIDNYVKSIMDALTGLAWEDDRQVVALRATKNWNVENDTSYHYIQLSRIE